MFCVNCGTQLPDEASFCWKCGNPQKSGIQVQEPKWETCEITWKVTYKGVFGDEGYFAADAIGSKGAYVAGRTLTFGTRDGSGYEPDPHKPTHTKPHNELISKLVNDGWESTGERGGKWWNHRFRRREQARTALGTEVTVVLVSSGPHLIPVIKALRELRHELSLRELSLREAKDLAETPESVIVQGVSQTVAQEVKSRLESLGATIELR